MAIPSAARVCHFCGRLIRPAASRASRSARPTGLPSITSRRGAQYGTAGAASRPSRPMQPADTLRGCMGPVRQQLAMAAGGRAPTRSFSSAAQRWDAVVTQNPRKDDEGNDMLVDITPRAAKRLNTIMQTESNPHLALRVTVESGGCHGFQYLMSLTNTTDISAEEDTLFETPDGARVVMDEPSLELLKGSTVDYTMELIGSQFKIVDNPAASSSCGCGTSFDIKA